MVREIVVVMARDVGGEKARKIGDERREGS